MQAFIAELKRRKVFRVAIAYCAAAWALLQSADVLLPILGLPDQSMRIMLYGIATFFPVAILLSWLFDVSVSSDSAPSAPAPVEEGSHAARSSQLQFFLTCMLVALIGFLYYERLFLDNRPLAPGESEAVDAGAAAGASGDAGSPSPRNEQSIAVLPFVNMSSDPDNVYFSDGVSEELLNVLAKVEGLRVAARTSSFRFRDGAVSVDEIGARLGVSMLLEGSVRRTARNVRVTAQLIDTRSGYHLWSEAYDGELDDIFALQDEIAHAVVRAIRPLIVESEFPAGPATENFEAYNAYLLGRAKLHEPWADEVLQEAVAHFERAIDLDAAFANAYAGLCDARLSEYTHTFASQAYVLAERACLRALALEGDDVLGWDLHIALGVLHREAGEYDKSMESLALAEEAAPGKARTLREQGMTHAAAGRQELAEALMNRALEIDSRDWDSYLVLANFYLDAGRYEEALAAYGDLLAIAPGLPNALIGEGSAQYMLGNSALAEETWLKAVALAESGDVGSAGVAYTNLGLLHYYRGEYAEAVQMHQRALQYRGDDHRVWGRIAESYRAMNNPEQERRYYPEAIRLAERDIRRNPLNWENLGLLGLYEGHSGNRDAAIDYMERMLNVPGLPATAHYFAALIHWSLGDAKEAYDEMRQARLEDFSVELLSNDPDLRSLRERDPVQWNAVLATVPQDSAAL